MSLDLLRLAATANLAPSVHNTQPTRWSLEGTDAIVLTADLTRRLAVGDAMGRDLRVSLGAALEGTVLALGQAGLAARAVDLSGVEPWARIAFGGGGEADTLAGEMERRCTWRRAFVPAEAARTQGLGAFVAAHADMTLIADRDEIEVISTLNERTSLAFYRHAPYRHELLSWMRLSPNDPGYGRDGLSAPAMGMSGFEAFGAGIVLGDMGFGVLDRLGLIGPLISEKSRTASAAAVVLFHRPEGEDPIETGRMLYRQQLALSALGFQTWPMSVLADDPESAAELKARYGVDPGHRLITAWRVGVLPQGAVVQRERLPADALITA